MSSQTDKATEKGQVSNEQHRNHPKWPLILSFSIVGFLGVIGILTLLYLSWYHTETNTQFFTQNTLNLLLLGAIIVQAIIYIYQWLAMQDSLAQTKKLFSMSERPSLGIIITYSQTFEDFDVTVANSGKSPARNVLIYINPDFYTKGQEGFDTCPEPQFTDPTPDDKKSCVFFPLGPRHIRITPIEPGIQEAIKCGLEVLYVWVYVTYEGLLGQKYFVESYLKIAIDELGGWMPTHNDGN